MLLRLPYLEKIKQQLSIHPVCDLIGPRQSGKTTFLNNMQHNLSALFIGLI